MIKKKKKFEDLRVQDFAQNTRGKSNIQQCDRGNKPNIILYSENILS